MYPFPVLTTNLARTGFSVGLYAFTAVALLLVGLVLLRAATVKVDDAVLGPKDRRPHGTPSGDDDRDHQSHPHGRD